MSRKFAAFDIDGTLFRSGLYREVVYELHALGTLPEGLFEQISAKELNWHNRTHGNAFEEFEMTMVTGIDTFLPKLRTCDFDTAVQHVIDSKADNVYVYTRNLLRSLQEQGYFTIAISGSQQELVEPFARRYGFDTWVGQHWERGDEFFTGTVIKSHTGKDKILKRLISEHNLTLDDSYAVGDSNGDSAMLGMVAHPIAFNPTTELFQKAIDHGWKIVVERKSTSYELEKDSDGRFTLANAIPR